MMHCQRVRELIDDVPADAAGLPGRDQAAFQAHLRVCAACRQEFDDSRRLQVLLRENVALDADTMALLESRGREVPGELSLEPGQGPVLSPAQVEAGLARLLAKVDEIENGKPVSVLLPMLSRQAPQPVRWRIPATAALAACLLLAAGAGLLYRQSGIWSTGQGPSLASSSMVMGQVSVLDPQGQAGPSRPVCAGQRLAAEGSRLQLKIGNRHNLLLEPGTRLALQESADHGCVLVLSQGRMDVSVSRAPGEGPFRIVTPQAELTVLGTQFMVSSTFGNTRLHVEHGTVQLASLAGRRQAVRTGQWFQTDGQALTQLDAAREDLLVTAALLQDSVAAIRQSDWYKQRFAPLLHLRDYLQAQSVPVEELTLLAVSAEPWCLQQPKDSARSVQPFIHRKAGLERATRWYGCRVEWLQPADLAAAVGTARQALAEGDLVLAYGLADQPVTRLTSENVEGLVGQPWQYRFLGEPEASRLVLCRIGKTAAAPSQADLAAQALADLRDMLAGPADEQYLVGQPAVRRAIQGWMGNPPVTLESPLLDALNGLARLGPACQRRLADAGMAVPSPDQQRLYSLLGEQTESLFTDCAFAATQCARAQRQDLVDRLCQALERCGR